MKKIIIIFVLTTYFFGMTNVYGNNWVTLDIDDTLIKLNIINEIDFGNCNMISRGQCLIAIMRIIGVTDKEVNLLNGADFVAFEDTDPYSYFGCAYRAKIAYGKECIVDYPTYRTSHTLKNTDFFFFSDRAVTVKETLAFMVRCLENSSFGNYDCIIEKASGYGLINDNDTFIDNVNLAINQNDFCVLLGRFLQQKRYKYFDRENNIFNMDGNIDEKQSMTYLEFLTQRQIVE